MLIYCFLQSSDPEEEEQEPLVIVLEVLLWRIGRWSRC